ncbi:MAG TPA: acyltransferase [Solirubrobacteraceae bacterium]|nr:acyltransferase [Solirubrobacteraceae bacterium]
MDAVLEQTPPRSTTHALPRAVSEAVPRQFAAGDALRGIAAMFVLIFHVAIEAMVYKHVHGFDFTGEAAAGYRPLAGVFATPLMVVRAGIYIFFALSGYLLTRGFLAAYTLGTPRPSISRYFRNRALRIIPAFWVITTIFMIWQHGWQGSGLGGVLAVYGFMQNYLWTHAALAMPQAWTLDLEVSFYILIPLAAVLALALVKRLSVDATPGQRLASVLATLLAAYVASLVFKHLAGNPKWLQYNIAEYLFAFIPGVALAVIEPFAAPRLRASANGRLWAWGLLAASVALLAAFVTLPVRAENLRLVAVSLGCGALMAAPLALQWATGGCWRVLDNRAMHWLGERSYGIYLIHLTLLGHLLIHIGQGFSLRATFFLLLLVGTAATLLASDVSWRLIERPALQRRLPWRRAEFEPAAPRRRAALGARQSTFDRAT